MEPTPEPINEPTDVPTDVPTIDAADESPLPSTQPPIPEPPAVPTHHLRVLRPGNLTARWTTTFWLGWAGVAGGFVAVWYSSRVTGLATWWLGPEAEPRSVLVNLLPFVAPLGLCVLALAHRRWVPILGILGAAVTVVVGAIDLGRIRGYGVIELVLAGAGLAVSVASFAGMLRRDPTPAG
jgi:hypothetical protein